MRYLAGLIGLTLAAALQAQEPTVFRPLTADQLEKTLKDGRIDFKKTPDKKENTFFYDFKAKEYALRLYYEDGRRLMLDTLFAAIPLEKVNDWNISARFSRAGLGKDEKGSPYTVLDAPLNLKGGVTEENLKEYLLAFVDDLDQFQRFVKPSEARKEAAKEEKTFTQLPADEIEKILTDMKIKYSKRPLGKDNVAYDCETPDSKIVLTNWGKDMMLEAKFAKLPLEKVNQYNVDRKFIRTVSYSNKNGQYSTLEANLNFAGGMTESILRNFIAVFEEDAREFATYAKKASAP